MSGACEDRTLRAHGLQYHRSGPGYLHRNTGKNLRCDVPNEGVVDNQQAECYHNYQSSVDRLLPCFVRMNAEFTE